MIVTEEKTEQRETLTMFTMTCEVCKLWNSKFFCFWTRTENVTSRLNEKQHVCFINACFNYSVCPTDSV